MKFVILALLVACGCSNHQARSVRAIPRWASVVRFTNAPPHFDPWHVLYFPNPRSLYAVVEQSTNLAGPWQPFTGRMQGAPFTRFYLIFSVTNHPAGFLRLTWLPFQYSALAQPY